MRNTVVGAITGLVAGAVIGATVLAPHVTPPAEPTASEAKPAPANAAAPAAPPAEAPRPRDPDPRWTLSVPYPASLPHLGAMAQNLERRLWRLSDGTFALVPREPAPGEKPDDALKALAAGTVDALFATPAQWSERSAALQIFGAMPFGLDAPAFVAWMGYGNGAALLEEVLAPEGLRAVLCGIAADPAAGWYRRPIRTVEDLKGLRIRTGGLGAKALRRLDARPVDLPAWEVMPALEMGTIDAAVFSLPAIDIALQLPLAARYAYFPGWQAPATAYYLMTSAARWEALPEIQKARVEAVCAETTARAMAEGEATQFAALRRAIRQGAETRRLPPEVLEALARAWDAVADEEAGNTKLFRKVTASMRAFGTDNRVWRDLAAP